MSYRKASAGITAMARAGICIAEAAILLEVASQAAAPKKVTMTVSALARVLKQPLSSVSRQAWSLAASGFLKYSRSTVDRRITQITITPKGDTLVAPFFEAQA